MVREFCKDKDENFKVEVYKHLIDKLGHYDYLFKDSHKGDPNILFDPEFSDLYLEYCHIIQHYLGCFNGVQDYLERPQIEYANISVSINVSDKSKTKIIGGFFKDGCEEENIDYQLN